MIFRDLIIGQTFHFSRNLESGLLIDLDLPGRDTFRKLSARTYECVNASTSRYTEGERARVGSVHARVWTDTETSA